VLGKACGPVNSRRVRDESRCPFNFEGFLPLIGLAMNYVSAFDGIPGLKKAVIGDSEGSLLEAMGGISSEAENTAGLAAVVTRQLGSVGKLLRLGPCTFVVVRSQGSARAIVPRQRTLASLELDPTRLSPEIEAKLRSTDWTSRERNRVAVRPPPVPLPPFKRPPLGAGAMSNQVKIGQPSNEMGSARTSTGRPLAAPAPLVPVPTPETQTEVVKSIVATGPTAAAQEAEAAPVGPAPTDILSKTAIPGRVASAEDNTMFSGNLQMICLPDLLEFCRNGRRTGTLMCSSGDASGKVRFREGMIIDATSPQTSARTVLTRLVDSGDASEEQLKSVTPSLGSDWDNVHIAQQLVSGGFTDPEVILKTMRIHVQAAISELILWTNGKFSFHPTTLEPGAPEPAAEFDPHMILLQIFKEQDEAAQGKTWPAKR